MLRSGIRDKGPLPANQSAGKERLRQALPSPASLSETSGSTGITAPVPLSIALALNPRRERLAGRYRPRAVRRAMCQPLGKIGIAAALAHCSHSPGGGSTKTSQSLAPPYAAVTGGLSRRAGNVTETARDAPAAHPVQYRKCPIGILQRKKNGDHRLSCTCALWR